MSANGFDWNTASSLATGAGTPRIILRHVVPNVLGPVIVYATLTVPQIILFESFLSFLGLGIQEPHASLGTLIAEGAGEMEAAPWMLLAPGLYLVALLVALPFTSVTGAPKFEPSIWNCTVPVGVPEPGGLDATVVVKVTDWP